MLLDMSAELANSTTVVNFDLITGLELLATWLRTSPQPRLRFAAGTFRMGKAKAPPPVAEVLALESKAVSKPTKVRLCDLDLTPSIYSHRDPAIYLYKADEADNQAKALIESLIVAGQKVPVAYCIENGKKLLLCGWRRVEAMKSAIQLQLDPQRFHAEMEIDALEVASADPRDILEWSVADNEIRAGLTDPEKVVAAAKMLKAGFSASRAARALGMSLTHFARYQRRLNSAIIREHVALGSISTTDGDNLLEAAASQNRTKDLECDFAAVAAKVERHIQERRAEAISRQEQFDEEKLGKVGSYIKPHHVRQWIKDFKEDRSIDWEPEPEQSQRNFECSFDPKEGKLHIQTLKLEVNKLTYEEYGQLAAKLDLTSRQVTADFLKAKAVREIRGLATQVEDSGVLDFYRKHGVSDLEAALERRVAQARGEVDPGHGKVAPRQEKLITDAIRVAESVSGAAVLTDPDQPVDDPQVDVRGPSRARLNAPLNPDNLLALPARTPRTPRPR
jgi:hypothetical protein